MAFLFALAEDSYVKENGWWQTAILLHFGICLSMKTDPGFYRNYRQEWWCEMMQGSKAKSRILHIYTSYFKMLGSPQDDRAIFSYVYLERLVSPLKTKPSKPDKYRFQCSLHPQRTVSSASDLCIQFMKGKRLLWKLMLIPKNCVKNVVK